MSISSIRLCTISLYRKNPLLLSECIKPVGFVFPDPFSPVDRVDTLPSHVGIDEGKKLMKKILIRIRNHHPTNQNKLFKVSNYYLLILRRRRRNVISLISSILIISLNFPIGKEKESRNVVVEGGLIKRTLDFSVEDERSYSSRNELDLFRRVFILNVHSV